MRTADPSLHRFVHSCIRLLVLCLVVGLVAAQPARAASPDEYRQALNRALAYVEHAQVAPSRDERVRDVREAIAVLESVTEVTLPDGTTLPVDNTHLLDELRKERPDLDRVAGRLRALIAELDRGLAAQSPADPAAAESLARILSDPRFRRGPVQTASSGILQQILDWLDDLLARPVEVGANLLVDWALPLGGALLVAVLLFLFARGLWQNLVPEASTGDLLSDDEAHLDTRTAHARALAAVQAGDARAAVRYLYLSTLLHLDEHGVLRFDRTQTNREYLRALRDQAPLQRLLSPVVSTFDRVWYGRGSISPEDLATYQHQVEDVRAARPEVRR